MADPPTELGRVDLRDGVAFRRFYDAALPVVYGYFLSRCGGRIDVAQELTQETFMSAVRTLRKGEAVVAPLPWIVAVARRRLVDHYRTQHRARVRSLEVFGHAPERTPGFETVTSDVDVRLQLALDRVPPEHRAALVLRYVDDLTVADVGRHLGCSVRAAESLLVRARRSLREAFDEEAHDG